jgi:hypothetical protein
LTVTGALTPDFITTGGISWAQTGDKIVVSAKRIAAAILCGLAEKEIFMFI